MKALLTPFTKHSTLKDEQLSSSLSQKTKSGKESGEASFLGMMMGFAGMKKTKAAAKENSSVADDKALTDSVNTETNATTEKSENEGDVHLTGISLEAVAKKETDTNKEAEKITKLTTLGNSAAKKARGLSGDIIISQRGQTKSSEDAKKPAKDENATVKKVNDLPGEKVLAPAKESIPAAVKATEGIINNNKQRDASITFKSAEIRKGDVLNKKINLADFKDTVTKIENTAHKAEVSDSTAEKKKPKLKSISVILEKPSKEKGSGVQNESKLIVNKDGKNAAKGSIAKQGKPVRTFPTLSEEGKTALLKNVDPDQKKLVHKDRAKFTFADKGRKQSVSDFFRKSSLRPDGKMKEQLVKQITKQPTHKEESRVLLSKNHSPESPGDSPSKATSRPLKLLNKKSFSIAASADRQKNIQTVNFQNLKGSDNDITIKEVELNNLKTIQLANTGGQSKFGKIVAQVARPQLNSQAYTAGQTTAWKHQRFILKDGNTVNISARTSSGSLQLQLSAGSDELSKIIQRHLHQIQQHVQQELNIKIDLQLQNFGGRQTNQQNESTSERSVSGNGDSNERNSTGNLTEQTGHRHIRYFGFNKNEWVA